MKNAEMWREAYMNFVIEVTYQMLYKQLITRAMIILSRRPQKVSLSTGE